MVRKKQKCPGIVIDAVRCAKLALDREIAGPLEAAPAYMMTPPLVDELAPEKQWLSDGGCVSAPLHEEQTGLRSPFR